MTYFISRHPGAAAWASARALAVDRFAAELDTAQIRAGDIVMGTLPVHLAAAVCARGGRYLHLSLDLPLARRGAELDAAGMEACGARLEEFRIAKV